MRIRLVFIGLMVVPLLVGCGGRSANPVASYQPGDEQRSCNGLKAEIASNEQEIIRLLPYEDAAGKNVALGVAGVFLIVPFFFMDFKDAEELEIRALRQRNQQLREIAYNNKCSLPASKLKFQDEAPNDDAVSGQGAGGGEGGMVPSKTAPKSTISQPCQPEKMIYAGC